MEVRINCKGLACEIKTLALSANKIGTLFDSRILGKSFIYIINNSGPSAEPCGTLSAAERKRNYSTQLRICVLFSSKFFTG
jgi:hypothetical protein